MLLESWKTRQIGEFLELEYGDGLPKEERSGQGYPVFGSRGVIGKNSKSLIEGPGIIVGRKGTVGAVSWSENDFWPIDTTYYVRLKENLIFRWVYWLLLHSGLDKLDASTGVPGLNRHEAYAMTVLVPPLSEQRRIAEILDSADEAIRATERVIAKLKQVKKGLLLDLLTRGLDENGHLRDPEAHLEQFKESALGRIPRSWKVYRLDDLPITYPNGNYGEMYPRAEDFTDRGVPFIRANNIKLGTVVSDEMRFISPELHAKLTRGHLKPGDVLITTRGELGNVALVPEQYFGANINAQLVIIRSTDTSISRWFFYSAQTNRFHRQIRELTTGTALKQLPASKLKQIQIVLPSENERSKIITLVNANDARIRAEEAKLAKLKQVKRGLMDDLLTGKVRVI
jgi:type I restriction enzyme S subunit